MAEKRRVLMICLGNICRSPIAEAVFQDQINKRGLGDAWEVDSAALINYHTGKCPDNRATKTLQTQGITDYYHKARQITDEDFKKFDWIFGMDNANIKELNRIQPEDSIAKIELLGTYDPEGQVIIVDPYYEASTAPFVTVYKQCLRSITAFLDKHTNTCT